MVDILFIHGYYGYADAKSIASCFPPETVCHLPNTESLVHSGIKFQDLVYVYRIHLRSLIVTCDHIRVVSHSFGGLIAAILCQEFPSIEFLLICPPLAKTTCTRFTWAPSWLMIPPFLLTDRLGEMCTYLQSARMINMTTNNDAIHTLQTIELPPWVTSIVARDDRLQSVRKSTNCIVVPGRHVPSKCKGRPQFEEALSQWGKQCDLRGLRGLAEQCDLRGLRGLAEQLFTIRE
jgi:esterase/lipase